MDCILVPSECEQLKDVSSANSGRLGDWNNTNLKILKENKQRSTPVNIVNIVSGIT
jgi:hypothetical protein